MSKLIAYWLIVAILVAGSVTRILETTSSAGFALMGAAGELLVAFGFYAMIEDLND